MKQVLVKMPRSIAQKLVDAAKSWDEPAPEISDDEARVFVGALKDALASKPIGERE
jgi:hypothetical protein